VLAVAAPVLFGMLGSCSLIEKVSDGQCASDGECAARGFAGASCVANVCVASASDAAAAADAASGPWICLGNVAVPDPPAGNVTLTFPFWNAVNDAPIPGITVVPCAKLDLACASPIAPQAVTGADGFFSLQVPGGFDGFLQVGWSQSYPTVVYINPPLVNSKPLTDSDLVTSAEFSDVVAVAGNGMMADPTLGHLFIGTNDCNGVDAAGVHLDLDHVAAGTVQTYLVGGLPSSTATETDSEASYVAINVPTGPLLVTATLLATGQRIGVATGNISAGQFTYLTLAPSP
jgi:hypothetical protein